MNEEKQVISTQPRRIEIGWLNFIGGLLLGYVLILILMAGIALFAADAEGIRAFLANLSPVPLIALGMVYFMLRANPRRSTTNEGETQP